MASKYYGSQNKFQIMPFSQAERLLKLLKTDLVISSEIDLVQPLRQSLKDIICETRRTLEQGSIIVKDIRLIGGAAAFIIDPDANYSYNDIDIVFSIPSCASLTLMDNIRQNVFASIRQLISKNFPKTQSATIHPEGYVKKQVCVFDQRTKDHWSLFSLGCNSTPNTDVVELKFASSIHRQYECSIDSFQILLDPALHFLDRYESVTINKNFYPTIVIESVWGCIKDAFDHLNKKHIVVDHPEQIRGGGLLKYCKLLINGFKPHPMFDEDSMKRYMCSRFFIDFPLVENQHSKIWSYLTSHFPQNHEIHVDFLNCLSQVVTTSSVNIGFDKIQFQFLISNIIQQLWSDSFSKIHLGQFDDPQKWSVGEICLGTSQSFPDSLSCYSSISTPSDISPDQSVETDSFQDDLL